MFRIVSALYFANGEQHIINGMEGQGLYSGEEPNIAAHKVYAGINKYMKKYNEHFPYFDPEDPQKILFVMQDLQKGSLSAFYSWRIPSSQGVRTLTGDNYRQRVYKWRTKVKKASLDDILVM